MSQGNKNTFTEDQAELLAAAQKKTLTRDGIIVEGVVPSAGKVLMVQDSERIKISPTTVNAIHSLSYESIFPIASMRERPFSFSGRLQMTITPETLAKGSLIGMILGYKIPNHIIKSLRAMEEFCGVESESIIKLAADMAKFENSSTLDMLKKLNESWFDPISYDFGITPEMFTRRYRRKKKLRPYQGKKRKRQIEKVDFSRRKFEMYKRASCIGVHKRHNETFESFRTRYFEVLFNSKRSGGHAR